MEETSHLSIQLEGLPPDLQLMDIAHYKNNHNTGDRFI